jgi:hypothetical protein
MSRAFDLFMAECNRRGLIETVALGVTVIKGNKPQ